ncbi:histidinol phosphate phosphatase [Candidatus Methylomirabilis lanthanidiphila]|uniref:Histidinol-phosphatase n=1 Tax=Candidatus Methylomirabilis lanthanidiphila TaxID=2211376 RepID=A0A564ZM48_9BACT|nr:histidinol-phosphatase [Candidatus Methylomirabilis lanthanidiphila]VUZ86405.1 histidinol phosphate phosphatase [Candidatus Methylomirabilis lanthanidiphila]
MLQQDELRNLLNFAVEAARQAGEITMEYFQTALSPERKPDRTFVTAADRQAEERLRVLIRQAYPDHGVIGEEFGEQQGDSGRTWIIDPLDGTASFLHGVPLFGVLLGLEVEGEVVLGVANLPALRETVYAARGMGCFWNGRRAAVSGIDDLKEALLLYTDGTGFEPYGRESAFRHLIAATRMHRSWGDCYGHILVATGRAEVMLDPVMSIWDCAALLPILREAGGTFTDWGGRPTIRSGHAISTNGRLLDQVMQIVKKGS